MNQASAAQSRPMGAARIVQRRRRLALLLGLVVLLGLAGFGLALAEQGIQANRPVRVLEATRAIQPGTRIANDELGVTDIRTNDPAVLATLVDSGERGRLVGRTAVVAVLAGGLVPADIAVPAATAGLWDVPVAVRRMPDGLKAGDHVALLASTATSSNGDAGDFVLVQDVEVRSVGQGTATLWLPARYAAQVEGFADQGGVVLARMPAGAVQQNLTAGGGG